MFKNKYEADNSRFGEVLTQVLAAKNIILKCVADFGQKEYYSKNAFFLGLFSDIFNIRGLIAYLLYLCKKI